MDETPAVKPDFLEHLTAVLRADYENYQQIVERLGLPLDTVLQLALLALLSAFQNYVRDYTAPTPEDAATRALQREALKLTVQHLKDEHGTDPWKDP